MDLEVPAWDFVLHTGTPRSRRFATGFPAFLTFIVSYPRIVVDIVILYRLGHNMPTFTDRGAMPSFLRSGNPSLALSHLSYFCWCAPHKITYLIFIMLGVLSSTARKMLESSKFIHISSTFALVRQTCDGKLKNIVIQWWLFKREPAKYYSAFFFCYSVRGYEKKTIASAQNFYHRSSLITNHPIPYPTFM